MGLIEEMLSGDERALARLITMIENGDDVTRKEILSKIYRHTGKAQIIGFTGAPGVGKSTLVDKVAAAYLKREKRVGIIAVDPSSPYSHGAILGDRIRMKSEADKNLFIRSLASRGKLGGLSRATNDVIKLLEAFGKEVILVETVGTGQSELEIAKMADSTVIVLSPGYGDEIQAMKAGILEIGDLFVVNKADLAGADRIIGEMNFTLEINYQAKDWHPKVLTAIAKDNIGVEEIVDSLEDHHTFLIKNNKLEEKKKQRLFHEFEENTLFLLENFVVSRMKELQNKEMIIDLMYNKEFDSYTLAEKMVKEIVQIKKTMSIYLDL